MSGGARRPGASRRACPLGGAAVAFAALLWSAALWAQGTPSVRILDRFDDLSAWRAGASDGVRASIRPAEGIEGAALRLDFDLGGTAGYALASRALPLDLPPNYELSFYLRGDAPANDLQVKLSDASGENVWWFRRPDYAFSRDWQLVRIKRRQMQFAWGPTTDRELRHAARIEFVVAAGGGGGKGSVFVSRLALRELPPESARWPAPIGSASSYVPGGEPSLALDGRMGTAWRSDSARGRAQEFTVDFGARREFGGLVLRWAEGAFASRYEVQLSDDGVAWRTVREVTAGGGGPDALLLPESEARFIRLVLRAGPADRYELAELEVKDLSFGASPNAFFAAVAREWPRGFFPRGFSGEQPYWTIVGVDGGRESALLSEDGALEVATRGFSIEPFVVAGSKVVTWADVAPQQSLREGYLPVPSVTWEAPQWQLRVTSFASGSPRESRLIARYDVANRSDRPLALALVLAVRPFQVNPPAQFLNAAGGVSPIRDVAWDGSALSVNGERKLFPLRAPQRAEAFPFDAGPLPKLIATPAPGGAERVHDASGYASAALVYPLRLAPRASATLGVVVPLSGAVERVDLGGGSPRAWLAREEARVAAAWREKLDRVSLRLPAAEAPLADTLRTALAHILITRQGPILRPGTRAYARSWIRDGAMISEALLRLGYPRVAADYLAWYAPHQFADGKVPCCVDQRGADPVPENDSAGELIFLAAEIERYMHDPALAEAMWPHVDTAVRYLDGLRRSERGDADVSFRGLLAASISHEGYAAKPVHSYWDDFWALKGYDGAVLVAGELGRGADAARIAEERDRFRQDLAESLRRTAAAHRIEYLPGSAELGDFDPASTAIAFAPGGRPEDLPAELVEPTFERYWREFVARRDGATAWEDYAPYEIRIVGTFARLGWRERARAALAFFMAGRRPAAWNQWAEVVGRDARKPRFVGDMPHAWVASDFINAALDLFAYERGTDRSLVLAAGVPAAWLEGPGVSVKNLRTPYGALGYSLRQRGRRIELRIERGAAPPGGFVFAWPGEDAPRFASVDGRHVAFRGGELRIVGAPATIVMERR